MIYGIIALVLVILLYGAIGVGLALGYRAIRPYIAMRSVVNAPTTPDAQTVLLNLQKRMNAYPQTTPASGTIAPVEQGDMDSATMNTMHGERSQPYEQALKENAGL